jgi:anti-sigma B factor antagonist
MTARLQPWLDRSVVEVAGGLRAPASGRLRRQVQALLDNGARQIVIDLSRVAEIDAAGVGELTDVFNAVHAAGGVLCVSHQHPRIRHVLTIVGLFGVLTTDDAETAP